LKKYFYTFVSLKRFLAISLFFTYFFSTTELHQLLKLPFLVEHFVEHKEQNNQMTLWQFLCLHYAQDDQKDGDYDKDRKLPFKSHDCCNNMSVVACITNQISIVTFSEKPIYVAESSFSNIEEIFFDDSFLSNIWQPPRLV